VQEIEPACSRRIEAFPVRVGKPPVPHLAVVHDHRHDGAPRSLEDIRHDGVRNRCLATIQGQAEAIQFEQYQLGGCTAIFLHVSEAAQQVVAGFDRLVSWWIVDRLAHR
jgi:hypothetical protein